jgi:hypothetical protein
VAVCVHSPWLGWALRCLARALLALGAANSGRLCCSCCTRVSGLTTATCHVARSLKATAYLLRPVERPPHMHTHTHTCCWFAHWAILCLHPPCAALLPGTTSTRSWHSVHCLVCAYQTLLRRKGEEASRPLQSGQFGLTGAADQPGEQLYCCFGSISGGGYSAVCALHKVRCTYRMVRIVTSAHGKLRDLSERRQGCT